MYLTAEGAQPRQTRSDEVHAWFEVGDDDVDGDVLLSGGDQHNCRG